MPTMMPDFDGLRLHPASRRLLEVTLLDTSASAPLAGLVLAPSLADGLIAGRVYV